MGITNVTPELNFTVSPAGTDYSYYWGPWMPCIAMDLAQATMKVANCANAVQVAGAMQLAVARTDKPAAPSAPIGTVRSTDNEYFISPADFAVAAAIPGYCWIRFGVAAKVSTGPNQGRADVAFQQSYLQLGKLLPPWTGSLVATDATKLYQATSGWMPAINLSKFVATITIGDIAGGLIIDFAFRTAATDPSNPDSWTTGLLALTLTANGETTSLERTLSITGKMWVQFGLCYYTAGGVGRADVTSLVGLRQAT